VRPTRQGNIDNGAWKQQATATQQSTKLSSSCKIIVFKRGRKRERRQEREREGKERQSKREDNKTKIKRKIKRRRKEHNNH
jgi:hypothetical protein